MINIKYRLPRNIFVIGIIVIIIAATAAGYFWNKKWRPKPSAPEPFRYVNLGSGYMFTVPDQYVADGVTMPGATIVYPKSLALQKGDTFNDLYNKGVVAVEPIAELKDNNLDSFISYTQNNLASALRKLFTGLSDYKQTKQGDVAAAEIFAIEKGGKRLRANMAINFTKPILIAAADYSDAFKTVGYSMEDVKKSRLESDINQASETAKSAAEMLKNQDAKSLVKLSTSDSIKQNTEKQLSDAIKTSEAALKRPITIVGGLYNKEYFIAQLVFKGKTIDELPVLGILSLKKIGKNWKLDGLQLPKPEK